MAVEPQRTRHKSNTTGKSRKRAGDAGHRVNKSHGDKKGRMEAGHSSGAWLSTSGEGRLNRPTADLYPGTVIVISFGGREVIDK